jgi:DNA repair protein RecN (Recombination protein N)
MPGLQHAERLTEAASEAHAAMRSEQGATESLAAAHSALARQGGLDPRLDRIAERLESLSTEAEDIAADLREYAEGLEHDPAALDAAQRRLAALDDLRKKHGPTLADVLASAERARGDLDRLDGGDAELTRLRDAVDNAREDMTDAAGALASRREAAAGSFVEALAAAAADLAMAHARFEVSFEDLPDEQWSPGGSQAIEFLYAPGVDQPARPLSRIASGGELSRVMLALKGVLGRADQTPVLVFDEVDAGIGGAAATSVGERLRDLSESHQVLVVTHLAQVAALADHHLVVEKESSEDGVATRVSTVEGEARVREVARMLSGSDSEAGLAHAHELLDGAAVSARP